MNTITFVRPRLLVVAAALLATACTSKPKPAKVTEQEKARSEERKAKDAKDGKLGKSGRGIPRLGKQVDALCESLTCTDAQREAAQSMLAAARARRFGVGRRSPLRNNDANKALAGAFSGVELSAEAIATYRSTPASTAPAPDDSKAIETVVALHAALTPAQRTTLAGTIRDDGLHGVTSPSGRPAQRMRASDPMRKATRIAKRMCTELACTDPQVESIAEIVAPLPEASTTLPADVREALATAVTGASLEKAAVQAYLAAEDSTKQARIDASDQAWLKVHALLDADQRKTLSETIAERGLQPIGTGRGRRRGAGGAGLARP